jgi:hypothetical protein
MLGKRGAQLKGQLHSSAGRSTKTIKDHERIEAVVEVAGAGRLVLSVDGGGGYSLRGYPEGAKGSSRNLLAVGVMRSDGIVAVCSEEALSVPPSVSRARNLNSGAFVKLQRYGD